MALLCINSRQSFNICEYSRHIEINQSLHLASMSVYPAVLDFPPQETFNNVWRHFCLPELGNDKRNVQDEGLGCWQTFYGSQEQHPTTRNYATQNANSVKNENPRPII